MEFMIYFYLKFYRMKGKLEFHVLKHLYMGSGILASSMGEVDFDLE